MKTSAVIYAAKSTQDKRASIPTQLSDCREMAEAEGWEVVAEYQDEGFSAYSGNRGPGLASALARAAKAAEDTGEVCMLVAQHSDRFSRGAGDRPGAAQALIEIWHAERRRNVHLRSAEDDFDLRTSSSTANIGERNRSDSERKSKSVRKGMARRRERGLHAGGDVYGYLRDPDVGLVAHPDQAPVVRRIFQMVADGASQAEVVRTLNREIDQKGSPLPLGGGRWQQGSLSNLLTRRTSVGETPADDWRTRKNRNRPEKWQQAAHEGIVSADLFAAAQSSNARRAKSPARGGGRRPKAGHLLTGQLLRHVCGSAMVPRSSEPRKDGSIRGWYECGGPKNGISCSGLNVPMGAVDEAILRYLAEVGVDAEASLAAAQSATQETADAVARELDAARAAAEKAKTNLARVRDDYMSGAITAADWNDLRGDLQAAADQADEHLEALKRASASPEVTVPVVVDALTIVRLAVAEKDFDGIRKVLRDLFEHFEIGETATDEAVAPSRGAVLTVDAPDPQNADEAEIGLHEHELPDPQPLEPAPGLIVLPVPRREALQSVMNDGEQVFLVDEHGRDVFRRLPIPTFNVNSFAITSSPPRSK